MRKPKGTMRLMQHELSSKAQIRHLMSPKSTIQKDASQYLEMIVNLCEKHPKVFPTPLSNLGIGTSSG